MSPLRIKDNAIRSRKSKLSIGDDSWRSELENLSLNDDQWSCVIGMIVETRSVHTRYLELFDEAAGDEKRESIYSLSYEKLIRGTKLLGKSNLNKGICNFASKKIEDEGESALDPWLICRLIKFFINRAKTRNLEILHSRARIEKEITKEIETLVTARPETTAKSKSSSGDARSFDKINTKLRKRHEEWRDRIHIDDAPIGGPNVYVVLSGFHDLNLVNELLDAELPLVAIFKVLSPGEEPDVEDPRLHSFWLGLEKTLKDSRTARGYSQVVFQTFCPPAIEESESESETLKTDIYRRISFLMYDLCDVKRQYNVYIRKMKLQSGLDERISEIQSRGIYDNVMTVFPEECISVPMILDALLSQISEVNMSEEIFHEEEISSEVFGDRLKLKIHNLNNKFDICVDEGMERVPENLDPHIIVHGDDLWRKTHHLKNCPRDFGLRVLRETGISMIWKNVPVLTSEKMKMHEYHVGRISKCFEFNVDSLTTSHYLHLLLFDKLINGERPRRNLVEREDLERKISFPSIEELRLKPNVKCTKSLTIASDKSLTESLHTSFRSDSTIEYRKEISETFECPELFGLIDTREILGSGYRTVAESFPVETPKILDTEVFDTVQLLSTDVFSQVFFTCYQEFDTFETRYFSPTDTMLIYFHNNPTNEKILKQEYAASIRTPVCLRDFSSYVIFEEKEWLEKEYEEYVKRLAEEAALRKEEPQVSKEPDDFSSLNIYTDADFILPNSIKGTELLKQKSHQGPIEAKEIEPSTQAKRGLKKAKETNSGKEKTPKKKGKVINPNGEKEERLETQISFSPLKNIPSEDAEPSFLGYDIADYRVQVSGFTSNFLTDDGTVIRVKLEEWTYGKQTLHISVKFLDNELVVHSLVDEQSMIFHFATSNGILMAFTSSLSSRESITRKNYQSGERGGERETVNGIWVPEMAVDPGFKVSWPSGLVVETLPGDSSLEPFYIKQSYLSKGPECNEISRETGRVFLRDGTIVVFLNDNSVRLMCLNGRIVTCYGFERREKEKETLSASKLKNKQNSKGNINEIKTKQKDFAGRNEILRTLNDLKNIQPLKILRKIVLEPDGRFYEIINDETILELGEKLVRTMSDYEVDEKFTRRSDGTDILLNGDGFLAVSFPDGSRITTGYMIENDPVLIEWTIEELEKFDYLNNKKESGSGENILENDGFVSIFLTSCMEHKNYATVTYDQSKINCELLMPSEVDIRISSDSLFDVNVGTATFLKVKRNEIIFSERIGTSFSSSVFNLKDSFISSIPKKSFLETTDSFGNVFSVDSYGKTSYKKFSGRSERVAKNENHYSSSSELTIVENNQSENHSKSYRLFAVNRDLSAYEYLRCTEMRNQEVDQTASNFFHRVNDEPEQILCTTLTALKPNTVSQAWLQPYRVKNIRLKNEDRKALLRSTYSVPWNYLIPYGKNGQGIWERSWNEPLKIHRDFSRPEILLCRTTETIKNQGDNTLKKLQKAMGCYWKKAVNNFGEYQSQLVSQKFACPEKREIENWLNDFALGGKKTFDKTLYLDGLLKNGGATQKRESVILKISKYQSEDKIEKEEIEWYKACLRDHNVPPYFTYIHGACFTWIFECLNKMKVEEEKVEDKRKESNKMTP